MTDHSNKLIETVAVSLLTALTVTSDTGWGSTIGKVMFAVLFTLMYAAPCSQGVCLLAYTYLHTTPATVTATACPPATCSKPAMTAHCLPWQHMWFGTLPGLSLP